MDYADGGDLSMKIKEQNGKLFPEDKILDWFTQVCLAIKHIHDRKILHRDIKSQNIFLMKTGQVKLGDFGIAKCLDQTMDKAKTYVGTPYYLSPEIINSQPYGFQSDIWSLGVLLYEMCALKMPFDASNLPQLYIKIINCNYQPLNDIYSNELKKLVKDMLNEQFVKRPTISEILNNPIIRPRIKKFLNESEYNMEFSHTILHNFKLNSSHNDEKMTKNELISNNINNNNNNNINNFRNNVRASQGHQRPIIKKETNERNLRQSANDSKRYNYQKQQMKQNKINLLKRDLEPKPNNLINKSNRQGFGKYNGNNGNILYNYNNGNNNNIGGGFYLLNEGKDYKMNDSKRNKKNKNMGREEFSSDKINKNNQNKINNINMNDNIYNGLRSENSAKFNLNKKRMEYEKKNNNIMMNNNLANNNNSYRDKDKERKQKLEEAKRKFRRENKNKPSNQDGVIWMRGMENYSEKKDDITNNLNMINNTDNINSRITDNTTEEPTNDRTQYDDLLNLNKNEISGKNLLPLNNISNANNMNNYSLDSQDEMNEEEINNNNKLYEDFFKGEVLNYNDNKNNNFNGMKYSNNNNDNQDIISKLNGNEIYEIKNMEINGDKVTEDIWNDISNDFGKELTLNISNIIKKYVYDDMLSYDFNKITENIIKDLKYKNISASLIEKAINKIPDIYYLVLCNKL